MMIKESILLFYRRKRRRWWRKGGERENMKDGKGEKGRERLHRREVEIRKRSRKIEWWEEGREEIG
jgi:hypothetical protein